MCLGLFTECFVYLFKKEYNNYFVLHHCFVGILSPDVLAIKSNIKMAVQIIALCVVSKCCEYQIINLVLFLTYIVLNKSFSWVKTKVTGRSILD